MLSLFKSLVQPSNVQTNKIDEICALAQKGNVHNLKEYLRNGNLNNFKFDLTQKNSKGLTVFEFLSGNTSSNFGIVLGITEKENINHLQVIVALLNQGAKPIPHEDIYKHYAFLQYGSSPWVAALFLMAGFNELPKTTEEYKNNINDLATLSSLDESIAYLDKTIREYASQKNPTPVANLDASSSSSFRP